MKAVSVTSVGDAACPLVAGNPVGHHRITPTAVAFARMNRTARPLDHDAVRAALVGLWARVDIVERTGSTNADLLAAATAGAPDRTVLVAEHQEAGRGRLARSWVSPPGSGLTVSVLLRPVGVSASRLGWLTLLAGLATYDAVRALTTTVPCGLKWPNDLLLGPAQRKVAGILAEVADAQRPAVVVGIGLNVAAAPADQPGATSLAAEGVEVGPTEMLIAVLTALARREAVWRAGRGDPDTTRVRSDYRAACLSLGVPVRVELPGGAIHTGIAEDVDPDGRLLLLDPAGYRRAVAAGDVVHLRSVGPTPT